MTRKSTSWLGLMIALIRTISSHQPTYNHPRAHDQGYRMVDQHIKIEESSMRKRQRDGLGCGMGWMKTKNL